MSKTHRFSKVMLVVACVAMIFAMSVGVSAANYSSDDAYYTVGDASNYATTSAITVTLDVQSKQVNGSSLNSVETITLNSYAGSSHSYTVQELLRQWADNHNYTLTTTEWVYDEDEDAWVASVVPFTSSSTSLFGINDGTNNYAPASTSDYDGWKVRVQSQLPQLNASYGALITQTYLNNKDVVTLYYDNSTTDAGAARFTRIYDVAYANNAATITVQQSYDWFSPSTWVQTTNPFVVYSGVTVQVYDASNNLVGSDTTNANGQVTISGLTDGATYTAKVVRTFNGNYIQNTGSFWNFTAE